MDRSVVINNKVFLSEHGPFLVANEDCQFLKEGDIVYTLEELKGDKILPLSEEQSNFYFVHADNGYNNERLFYMIEETQEEKINRQIEEVKRKRQKEYRTQSDHLYLSYQKDLLRGDVEKAEISKQIWLKKVQEIEENNPYPTE